MNAIDCGGSTGRRARTRQKAQTGTERAMNQQARIQTPVDGLSLRRAGAEDAETVLAFIKALAEYEKLSHEVSASEDDIRRHLAGEEVFIEVVLAELEGTPVGFMLFFPNFSTFLGKPGLYLEDLFVIPEMRGRGVGRALLAYAAHIACTRGWGRLEWSVLDWNEPARRFYASIGAAPKSEWILQRLSGEELRKLAAGIG
jgi:GNAT superfamily N-acetyltransferase